MDKIEKEIIELLLAKERAALTPDEEQLLQRWLESSASHPAMAEELKALYRDFLQLSVYERIDSAGAWEKVKARTTGQRLTKRMQQHLHVYRYRVAAVLIPFLILASVFFFRPAEKSFESIRAGSAKAILELADGVRIDISTNRSGVLLNDKGVKVGITSANTLRCLPVHYSSGQMNTLVVPIGAEYRIVLCDGTRITVNSGSKIRYPYAFGKNERRVELEGEAYFDVAKDASRPFIVRSPDTEVKVLGTHFNFSAYPDDRVEHVTLEEGRVAIRKNGQNYELLPGDQYQLDKTTGEPRLNEVDTYLYTSWVKGQFRFQNLPLSELCTKLSRWYDVKFVFEDKATMNLKFTGAFERSSNLNEFVNIIESTTRVNFELKGDVIAISGR